eukprot:jgi/Mesvir1/18410/Mv14283-RA.3
MEVNQKMRRNPQPTNTLLREIDDKKTLGHSLKELEKFLVQVKGPTLTTDGGDLNAHLNHIPLFKRLEQKFRAEIVRKMAVEQMQAGTPILYADVKVPKAYLLLSGTAMAQTPGVLAKQKIEVGSAFGHNEAVLTFAPGTVVMCATDVVLATVHEEVLVPVLRRSACETALQAVPVLAALPSGVHLEIYNCMAYKLQEIAQSRRQSLLENPESTEDNPERAFMLTAGQHFNSDGFAKDQAIKAVFFAKEACELVWLEYRYFSRIMESLAATRGTVAADGTGAPGEKEGGARSVLSALAIRPHHRTDEDLFILNQMCSTTVLKSLKPSHRLEICRLLELRIVKAGQAVFRQGDVGDRMYIILSGHVSVIQDGQVITHLGPGDQFGEVALMKSIPRTATITCMDEDCHFATLDRKSYNNTLRSTHLCNIAAVSQFLQRTALLNPLPSTDVLNVSQFVRVEEYAKDTVVVTQNCLSPAVYFIMAGSCKVVKSIQLKEDAHPIKANIAVLVENDFFGEISVITGEPMTMSIHTLSACKLLAITRDHFCSMRGVDNEELERIILEREERWESLASRAAQAINQMGEGNYVHTGGSGKTLSLPAATGSLPTSPTSNHTNIKDMLADATRPGPAWSAVAAGLPLPSPGKVAKAAASRAAKGENLVKYTAELMQSHVDFDADQPLRKLQLSDLKWEDSDSDSSGEGGSPQHGRWRTAGRRRGHDSTNGYFGAGGAGGGGDHRRNGPMGGRSMTPTAQMEVGYQHRQWVPQQRTTATVIRSQSPLVQGIPLEYIALRANAGSRFGGPPIRAANGAGLRDRDSSEGSPSPLAACHSAPDLGTMMHTGPRMLPRLPSPQTTLPSHLVTRPSVVIAKEIARATVRSRSSSRNSSRPSACGRGGDSQGAGQGVGHPGPQDNKNAQAAGGGSKGSPPKVRVMNSWEKNKSLAPKVQFGIPAFSSKTGFQVDF